MKRIAHMLRSIDLTFVAGALAVLGLVGAALEVGRAVSVAMELKSAVAQAGELALQSYAERRDADLAEQVAGETLADAATAQSAASLTAFQVSEADGVLRVVGTAPVEMRLLAPLGLGQILLDNTYVAPLPPSQVAKN